MKLSPKRIIISAIVAGWILDQQPATTAACVNAPVGLIGWWSGEGTADLAGTNSGTLSGNASIVTGQVDAAFWLDGFSGYVSTTLDVQPGALPRATWEAWVYPTRLGGRQQILSSDDGGYDRSVMVDGDTYGVFTGNSVWRPAAVVTNQWTHLAVVFTPDNILFYTNGVEFSLNAAPLFGGTVNKLQIGRNPGYGEYFQGLVDEVSVYDRALSAAEIIAIVAAGNAGKCKSPGAYSDLSAAITSSSSKVYLMDRFTNTVTLINLGPSSATTVSARVQLAAEVNLVSASVSAGTYVQSGKVVTFQAGNLSVGAASTMALVLQPLTAGEATNTVSVYGGQPDADLGNNQASSVFTISNLRIDSVNGDWEMPWARLEHTSEADIMIRSGDIDNLNFGWPPGFDPFSGNSTPGHAYPWAVRTNDPPGTDRIMVGSGYDGHPPRGSDGYTSSTSRPDNLPQTIVLSNPLPNITITSALLQLFVDDFQAPLWGASYQVTINGMRAPFLEEPINQLLQTGPIGRLITVQIPPSYLNLVSTGNVSILIDDPITGAGDGYALDFVKLLLNPHGYNQTGTVTGNVRENLFNQPVEKARVSGAGGFVETYTDAQGNYILTNVPAGLVFVSCSKFGYADQSQSVNLVANTSQTVNFQLTVIPELRILGVANGKAILRWPAPLSNWILERTPQLSNAGNSWTELVVDRSFVDGETQATPPILTSAAFYRLRKP